MVKKDFCIIQFDPDDYYITVVDLILSVWGLKLCQYAKGYKSIAKIFENIKSKKLPKIDIAIIESYIGRSEKDGFNIATKLREIFPDIRIIGYSTMSTSEWADYEAIKGLKDSQKKITDILAKLTGNEYLLKNPGAKEDRM